MSSYSFNRNYFTDEEIIDYINNPKMFTTVIAVKDPETDHQVMCPVWTIFYKGKFYFSTDNTSKKCRIIEKYSPKIGLTIIEPESFPQGREGVIPYFSTSGSAKIRTKDEFSEYEDVIHALYDKFDAYFPSEEGKTKWINHVLNESDTRVLVEFPPEKTFIYEKIEARQSEKEKNDD